MQREIARGRKSTAGIPACLSVLRCHSFLPAIKASSGLVRKHGFRGLTTCSSLVHATTGRSLRLSSYQEKGLSWGVYKSAIKCLLRNGEEEKEERGGKHQAPVT